MALLEMLRPQIVSVKPVEEWPCAQIAYEVQSHSMAELRRSAYLPSPENERARSMRELDYHLLCEARKLPEAQRDPRLACKPPGTFEEFLALIEAAFGEEPADGRQGSGTGKERCLTPATPGTNSALTRPSDILSVETGGEGWTKKEGLNLAAGLQASPFPGSQPLTPKPPPTVRSLAELLWDAATLPRRRAEEETRGLTKLLTDYAAGLASASPEEATCRQGVAADILKLFRDAGEEQARCAGLCRRVRLALYDIGVARFGKRDELKSLVYPGDRMQQLESEWIELYAGQVPRVEGQEPKGERHGTRDRTQKARGRSEKRSRRRKATGKRQKARD